MKERPQGAGWEARLERYRRAGSPQVRGWLDDQVFEALLPIGQLQAAAGILGAIYEIGVYEGRFLLALAQLARPGEALVAIDLFALPGDSPAPRIRSSEPLRSNVARHATDAAALAVIEADSTALEPARLRAAHGPARLFSIDGAHDPESTRRDLVTAAALLAPGGVVFLDDCFNPHFPGVQEGLARYMLAGGPPDLAPFAHYGNKLLLTDPAHQPRYLAALLRRVQLDQVRRHLRGEEHLDARPARCWDWDILALRSPGGEGNVTSAD